MRRYLTVAAVLIIAGFVAPRSVAAEICQVCYERVSERCGTICAKAGKDIVGCHGNCSRMKCRDSCAFKEVAPAESKKPEDIEPGQPGSSASCEACLKQMEQNPCQSSCRNREDPRLCSKRCAKVRCTRRCSLPGSADEPSGGPVNIRPTEQACADCKKKQQIFCAPKCGNKERAGYLACEVACVEGQCLQTCKPGLF